VFHDFALRKRNLSSCVIICTYRM